MEAMCRIGDRYGYKAVVAEASPSSKTRAAKFHTGRTVWDGKGSVDVVWLHQQGPNFMGGPSESVCEAIDFLARGLHSAKRCVRLVVDNNESMRHGSVYGIERRTECESFKLAGAEIRRKVDRGEWTEAARRAGVTCALTTEGEVNRPTDDPFSWGRFNVYESDTPAMLEAKLAGWYGWAPKLQERVVATLKRIKPNRQERDA